MVIHSISMIYQISSITIDPYPYLHILIHILVVYILHKSILNSPSEPQNVLQLNYMYILLASKTFGDTFPYFQGIFPIKLCHLV